MNIRLNGKTIFYAPCILSAFLAQQGYTNEGSFSVAVNQTFVPRSQYASHQLQENDEVEIVTAMQGG